MTIVKEILQQMPAVGKPQAKFLETLFATILALRGRVNFRNRRCRKGVDLMLDCDPKLGAIDEETNDQIVHRRRFGKANRAAHEPFDPGPQIDVFALDFLRIVLANVMLLRVDMPLVRPPPIRVKAADTKRLQQRLQLQKDRILPSPEDVRQHGATLVIDGMPQPSRFHFLAHITPHLIKL